MRLRTILLGASLMLASFGMAQQFPVQQTSTAPAAGQAQKDAMAKMGLDQKLGDTVDKTPMVVTEFGKKIPFGDLTGTRPIILLPMFYTCKSACGIEVDSLLKNLAKITDYTVGKDYDVVFLSINPKETPDVAMAKKQLLIQDYDRNGSTAGFHFLTGSFEDVNKICRSVGFRYVWNAEKEQVFHPTGLIILTKTGMISRYFYGTEYSSKLVESALVSALRQQVGAKATPIMLGCIMLDPVTGARTLNIMRTLQVLGLLTLIVLFGSMAWMNARHKETVARVTKGGTPV